MGPMSSRSTLPAAYRLLHRDAVQRLSAWDAPSAQQDACRADLLAHLAAHPDAMCRQGPPEHFTASTLVLDPSGANVLLTLHAKARAWFQFGGHFEPADGDVLAGAAREAREESGIADLAVHPDLVAVDRHELSGSFGRCREHLDLRFAAIADPALRHAVSPESLDVRWWPVEQLPPGTAAELLPLVGAARRALGLALGGASPNGE